MFERFTEPALRTLFFARDEARELGSTSIDVSHLALGLIRGNEGLAVQLIAAYSESSENIRKEIESRVVFVEKLPTDAEMPFSAEMLRALTFAAEEADALKHDDIGTEHLLLGILRDSESVAATALHNAGLRLNAVREQIARLRHDNAEAGRSVPQRAILLRTVTLAVDCCSCGGAVTIVLEEWPQLPAGHGSEWSCPHCQQWNAVKHPGRLRSVIKRGTPT